MQQGSRVPFFFVMLSVALFIMPSFAQEPLKEPSRGVVTGVPTQQPYGGNLLVRLKADLESQVLGYVSNGDEVTIDNQSGSFFHLTSPKSGWCWASYIRVTESKPAEASTGKQPVSIEEYFFNSKVTPRALELAEPDPGTVAPERYQALFRELREYWQRMGLPASPTP